MGLGECLVETKPRRINRVVFQNFSGEPIDKSKVKKPVWSHQHCSIFRYDPFSPIAKVTKRKLLLLPGFISTHHVSSILSKMVFYLWSCVSSVVYWLNISTPSLWNCNHNSLSYVKIVCLSIFLIVEGPGRILAYAQQKPEVIFLNNYQVISFSRASLQRKSRGTEYIRKHPYPLKETPSQEGSPKDRYQEGILLLTLLYVFLPLNFIFFMHSQNRALLARCLDSAIASAVIISMTTKPSRFSKQPRISAQQGKYFLQGRTRQRLLAERITWQELLLRMMRLDQLKKFWRGDERDGGDGFGHFRASREDFVGIVSLNPMVAEGYETKTRI